MAKEWFANSRSVEGPNRPDRVAKYAELMRKGQWQDMTFERGGIYYPIVFDDHGRARYGLQRLEACAQAGVPFTAVVVRWPVDRCPVA